MEQVPKIVRQRLQAVVNTAIHPDPDVLAAFAEKSLSQRERNQVLEHLGQCRDCRDVILLAGPDGAAAAASTQPPRLPWLRWPVLRWGTAAACVVIVSAAVMLRHEHLGRAPSLASFDRTSPVVASPKPAAEGASPEGDSVAANIEAQSQSRPELPAPPREAKRPAKLRNGNGGALASSPAPDGIRGYAESTVTRTAPAPPSPRGADIDQPERSMQAQKEEVEVGGAATVNTETVAVTAQAGPVITDLAELAPERAKDAKEPQLKSRASSASAIVAGANNYKLSASGARNDLALEKALTLAPRWTLSPDGVLERSMDAGRTWETISVPATSALRALAAVGPDIWVGGAAGALYHSSDMGRHWVAITPAADGKPLTADIIGVTFTDAAHGKLTTANNETWTTSDAGQSWQEK
jgi:Photosynthesis system II assembly factor YCF48